MPADASLLYARNQYALVQEIWRKDGTVVLDKANEIVVGATVVDNGTIARPDVVG